MRRNDAEIFALRRSGVRGMKESSAEYPGRRSQSAKSSAGVGYRFAMGKASAGRGIRYRSHPDHLSDRHRSSSLRPKSLPPKTPVSVRKACQGVT